MQSEERLHVGLRCLQPPDVTVSIRIHGRPPTCAERSAPRAHNDRALLQAARAVVAEDGAHASVAAIAARAGVGVGTLYRRYRAKEQLFQHLCILALNDYLRVAEEGLAHDDPWEGFVHYATHAVMAGTGALGAIAGTIEITDEMSTASARGDAIAEDLIRRAHDAGVLRTDAGAVDIALLIERLGRSPLVEQLTKQGRTDMVEAAEHDRRRRRYTDRRRPQVAEPLERAVPGVASSWRRPPSWGRWLRAYSHGRWAHPQARPTAAGVWLPRFVSLGDPAQRRTEGTPAENAVEQPRGHESDKAAAKHAHQSPREQEPERDEEDGDADPLRAANQSPKTASPAATSASKPDGPPYATAGTPRMRP
ncbi:MAG: TetR/AcrR family transcriptional regulator [Dehalococcoidia bacterium]